MQFSCFKKAPIKLAATLLFTMLLTIDVKGQSSKLNYHTALNYRWEINTKRVKPEPMLFLKNSGSSAIPGAGWSIYFNSIKKPLLLNSDSLNYQLTHLNGDLFKLNLKPVISAIQTSEELKIALSVPDIRNFTELPSGFYLVYDHEPQKGYLLLNKSDVNNSIEPEIALSSYQKNEQLNTLPGAAPALIFPSPLTSVRESGSFLLNQNLTIVSDPQFNKEAELLADELAQILGKKPVVSAKKTRAAAITLIRGASPTQGYLLRTEPQGITITASTASGIFYGIQSLKTLFPADTWARTQQQILIPAVQVSDAPRFEHRALMLDIARNFQSKEKVYKVLDLMALYKMNILRLHFNDDEGWRIEIPGLPELTSVGSRRGHAPGKNEMLPPSYGSGPDSDNGFATGYFSRKEYIALLKYARARHIAVIPEIESPGHARAAIKSMDARYLHYMKKGLNKQAEQYLLSDQSDSSVYRSVQGWNDNVMNPALASTYNFIRKVSSELVKMHQQAGSPLKTIHMGGDEVPEGVWAKSPAVKTLLATDSSIGSVYGMWKYYFSKVNDILKTQQLYLSGWEEIGLKKTIANGRKKWILDPSVAHRGYTADVWNNIIGTGAEDLAYQLANNGFKVVLSNVTNMYLDMAYNNSFYEHGMNWAGFVNVDKPFFFIPYNYYLTTTENEYGQPVSKEVFKHKDLLQDTAKKNIVGLQAALWSETIVQDSLLEYMLLPKLLGAAERSWAKDPAWPQLTDSVFSTPQYLQAWNTFTTSLGLRELPRLDHYKGGFLYRIPEPGVEHLNGVVKANVQLPGFKIRYTTDGSEPNQSSPVYSTPITAKGKIVLKVFNSLGRSGKKVTIENN